MPYTNQWGEQAKKRSKKRLEYFKLAIKGFRHGNHLKVRGERIAKRIMPEAIYVDKSSHDFLWDGKKVEVKSANKHKSGRWYFRISNPSQKEADYFLLIFLVDNRFKTAQLVPTEAITSNHTINCDLGRFAEYQVY